MRRRAISFPQPLNRPPSRRLDSARRSGSVDNTGRPDAGDAGPKLEIRGVEAGISSKIAALNQLVATDWRPPSELPDLRRVNNVAIDTEANDEGLRADRGSAWPWRGGHICGISVAWRDGSGIRAQYFPI